MTLSGQAQPGGWHTAAALGSVVSAEQKPRPPAAASSFRSAAGILQFTGDQDLDDVILNAFLAGAREASGADTADVTAELSAALRRMVGRLTEVGAGTMKGGI